MIHYLRHKNLPGSNSRGGHAKRKLGYSDAILRLEKKRRKMEMENREEAIVRILGSLATPFALSCDLQTDPEDYSVERDI